MTTKAQDLEAAFEAERKTKTQCGFGRVLDGLEPDLRKVVETKVGDDLRYDAELISRVLKKFDVRASAELISKHRKGDCRCTA